MTEDREETYELLAKQRLGRSGLLVKLDKGFTEGTYGVYVEFDDLAQRDGFAAAHRAARQFGALLKAQLARVPGYALGQTEDASRYGGPGRQRDLEATFLSFPLSTADGQFHDADAREHFRVTFLRAAQAWDQFQAKEHERRRGTRQERFRQRLAELLEGGVYTHLDGATKARLLDDVCALVFPPRGIGP